MSCAEARVLAIGVLALVSLLGGGPRGLAEVAVSAEGAATPSHPAHIHAGSCASLDPNPRIRLSDVATGAAEGGAASTEAVIPVATGVTTIDVKLTDILAGQYAINVHEGVQSVERSIACGEIGGRLAGDDLVIGLRERDGSGYAGIAWLRANGDTTTVTVFLAHGLVGPASGGDTQPTQARVTFYVETVTCPGCQLRVEGSIQKAPGILDVTWEGQQVTVTYDPDQVSPDTIKAAIEQGGDTAYEVTEEE